ncbi:MAG TPA: DUF222 domain-containing protein [Actinomycetota bacterium]|nr:DUF222 domain-containing protein [Actinomycetota bacterium]
MQRASEAIEAERVRRLRELERRGVHGRDGHLSMASWLASKFKLTWGHARRDLHLARALEEMPETRRAWEDGDLSGSAVRVLVAARDENPAAFAESEGHLVEAARIHSANDLRKIAAYWRNAVERERALDGEDGLRERRRLHASVSFMGMVRLDGDLDPETGETLLTALRAVLDAEARSTEEGTDRRTPAQRRADALVEICRQWLDSDDRPAVGGERPHVTVTVGAEVLRDGTGEPSEADHVGPVGPEVARKVACDAQIRRVVLSGASEPLDVGRRTPVIPPGMRRAVVLRDRHCRFPGCDRPHTWCDVHHVVHWADGGPTAVPNLLLLCRRHHGMVHRRGGFTLTLEDGRPLFRRPDGSVLEERAPPRAS